MTLRLTAHLFAVLLSLSSAAVLLWFLAVGPSSMNDTGWVALGFLFGSLGYAAYNIASIITLITETTK